MEIRLQEFIKKTIEEINSGLPKDYVVDETIDFKVSVTTSTNKSGGVEIKVVSGGIEKGNELVQTVSFAVVNEVEKEKADKKTGDKFLNIIDEGIKKFDKHPDLRNKEHIKNILPIESENK